MRKTDFCQGETKAQISFAVTAKLISAFVFATRIVQFLFYLNPKFQASSSFLSLYRPVCVGPGRKPRRPVFSRRGSYFFSHFSSLADSRRALYRSERNKCGLSAGNLPLGGLPRNIVARKANHPDMTLVVDHEHKAQTYNRMKSRGMKKKKKIKNFN